MSTSRDIAKKATSAAFEKTMLSFLPSLQETLTAIRDDIRHLDIKVDNLRHEMYDRFEQQLTTINQLGDRIARVEGSLEQLADTVREQGRRLDRQSDRMDQWIERVVRVEMTQSRRVKRAS